MSKDDGNILLEPHTEEQFVSAVVHLDNKAGKVKREEYIFYLRARKRLLHNEPLPESTFKDIQNPVLRRRLVRAICLKKVTPKPDDTKDGAATPMT